MPKRYKFNATGNEADSLINGDWAVLQRTLGGGPTGTTGFRVGGTPPAGGWIIYGPGENMRIASDDTELLTIIGKLGGTNTNVDAAKTWVAGQSGVVLVDANELIVDPDLVFYVDAAETASYPGSGTTLSDLSGNGKNGTLTNGASFDSADGGSITFDGSNDYVGFGNITSSDPISFSGQSNVTIATWVYPETGGDPYQRIIDKSNGSNGSGGWAIGIGSSPNTTKRVFFSIDGTNVLDSFDTGYTLDGWNYIALTKNGSENKYYINGSLIATTTSAKSFPSTTAPMYIGTGASRDFNGKIQSIAAYKRTLTATELLRNYNAFKSRFGLA